MNFLNLLLVLAGTVLGLAGGVFATIYAQNRQSKREIFKELRSNLLMAALEISKIRAWAEKREHRYLFAAKQQVLELEKQRDPSPTEKIEAIMSLYFPEIYDDAIELSVSALDYERHLIELAQKRQKQTPPILTKEQMIVRQRMFKDILKSQQKLVKALRKLMVRFRAEKLPASRKTCHLLNKFRRD